MTTHPSLFHHGVQLACGVLGSDVQLKRTDFGIRRPVGAAEWSRINDMNQRGVNRYEAKLWWFFGELRLTPGCVFIFRGIKTIASCCVPMLFREGFKKCVHRQLFNEKLLLNVHHAVAISRHKGRKADAHRRTSAVSGYTIQMPI